MAANKASGTAKSPLQLQGIVRGFANHRRIQMLTLLDERPELSVLEVTAQLRINLKTASEHLRRLAVSGLVMKRAAGTYRNDDITTATVFDLGVNWRLQPASKSMLISARLENLFDDKYRTMPGLPLLGFMFVTRLQYSF